MSEEVVDEGVRGGDGVGGGGGIGIQPPTDISIGTVPYQNRRYFQPSSEFANYTSIVWRFFRLYEEDGQEGKVLSECSICGTTIQYNRNTSNMLRHLSRVHRQMYLDAGGKERPSAMAGGTPGSDGKESSARRKRTNSPERPPSQGTMSDAAKILGREDARVGNFGDPILHAGQMQQAHQRFPSSQNDPIFGRGLLDQMPEPPLGSYLQLNTAGKERKQPRLSGGNRASIQGCVTPLGGGSFVDDAQFLLSMDAQITGKFWSPNDRLPPPHRGFGNEIESEAVPNSLPKGCNTPQVCPRGLYAEQISGSPFTTPRTTGRNYRTWMYRLLPSAAHHSRFEKKVYGAMMTFRPVEVTPERLRWKPIPIISRDDMPVDFIDGVICVAGCGDESTRDGIRIYIYGANSSMMNRCFYNSDGDWLIVPQMGVLKIKTELGRMIVSPGMIALMPQGIKFSVDLGDDMGKGCRGYILEVFGRHFELPDLGPIGANGLASARDFEIPSAWFEEVPSNSTLFEVYTKFQGDMFRAEMICSPFDVVAWHGNYYPCTYDLSKFCPINSVLFDHMDPSIFTVLSARSDTTGSSLADFVIFPPRWAVQEATFRPPYFHRNCMTEFMGIIRGAYDAKGDEFGPGGASLHPMMTPHGPDDISYFRGAQLDTSVPQRMGEENLAFMFESSRMVKVTSWALETESLDREYPDSWKQIPPVSSSTFQ